MTHAKPVIAKTFRFEPELITDAEKIIEYSGKYPTFTSFVVAAMSEQIRRDRKKLEKDGLWKHAE